MEGFAPQEPLTRVAEPGQLRYVRSATDGFNPGAAFGHSARLDIDSDASTALLTSAARDCARRW